MHYTTTLLFRVVTSNSLHYYVVERDVYYVNDCKQCR